MTNKEQLIQRQKESLRMSIVSLLLAVLCLVCGLVVFYGRTHARDDFLTLHAGFIAAIGFFILFLTMFCNWCYLQGYLKHMPDNHPIPPKLWHSNIIPFRRRRGSLPPESLN